LKEKASWNPKSEEDGQMLGRSQAFDEFQISRYTWQQVLRDVKLWTTTHTQEENSKRTV